MANAVAKKEDKLPAEMMDDLMADSGKGLEGSSSEDMIIPFLKMAQSLSPEVKKSKPEYIQGLEEGMLFNSATREIYGEEVYIVPCKYERQYLEFVPVENGGGFRGQHPASILDECKEGPLGEQLLPDGNEIVICGVWYVLVLAKDGSYSSAVISLAKSQFKQSKKLMTKLRMIQLPNPKGGTFNPPPFYNLVKVKGLPTSNDKGDWMLWDFELDGSVLALDNGKELYENAKSLIAAIDSGAVKAAEPESPSGSNDMPDDEVPF